MRDLFELIGFKGFALLIGCWILNFALAIGAIAVATWVVILVLQNASII